MRQIGIGGEWKGGGRVHICGSVSVYVYLCVCVCVYVSVSVSVSVRERVCVRACVSVKS